MWPLIGISRPDAEEPRHAALVRPRRAVRRDPVVDDLEARLVEALGVGQVARQAARDRDVDVREARHRAVAEREGAALAELVEAVLRREPDRHARERPGHLPVRVGVDEVRVQDPRPEAREVADEPEERDRVDVRRRAGSRRAARRAQSSRGRSPRRPARSRAASAAGCPSRAPAAAAGARAGAPPSRRCRPPSAGAGRPVFLIAARPRGYGPPTTRRSGAPRPARAVSGRARACPPAARPPAPAARGQRRRILARESQRRLEVVEQLVEDRDSRRRRAGSSRRPRRRPCRAPRPHVVDEGVRPREERGDLRAQNGVTEPDPPLQIELLDEPLDGLTMGALLGVPGRAVDDEPRVEPLVERQPQPAEDRLEPLRRRVAAERNQAEVPVRCRAATCELGHVDPVTGRDDLARGERERAAVDGHDVGRQAARRGGASGSPSSACTRAARGTPSGRASGAASTA